MSSKKSKGAENLDRLKTSLIQEITDVMKRDGVTQGEVARRIGALRPNINVVLRRNANASFDFLMRIAGSVGLEVDLKIKGS